jgi:hypothetical protein
MGFSDKPWWDYGKSSVVFLMGHVFFSKSSGMMFTEILLFELLIPKLVIELTFPMLTGKRPSSGGSGARGCPAGPTGPSPPPESIHKWEEWWKIDHDHDFEESVKMYENSPNHH